MGTLAVAGQKVSASFPNQYYGSADVSATTVTAAAQTALTTSYTIPANEPAAGSAYSVEFGGNGTWGATQQTLAFTFTVGGTITCNNITLGAQAFAASAVFRFAGVARLVWSSTGVSGIFKASYLITVAQQANNIAPPGTYTQGNFQGQDSWSLADSSTSGATDTTGSLAVLVKCAWGATTGAPTITNQHTIFRKIA